MALPSYHPRLIQMIVKRGKISRLLAVGGWAIVFFVVVTRHVLSVSWSVRQPFRSLRVAKYSKHVSKKLLSNNSRNQHDNSYLQTQKNNPKNHLKLVLYWFPIEKSEGEPTLFVSSSLQPTKLWQLHWVAMARGGMKLVWNQYETGYETGMKPV